MTSPEKIAANRQNARRSTGPRTPAGKRAARRNALKHGLLAEEVLLASENARDLEDLARRLCTALRPADDLEALLVDRIVSCAWRLRRALQAEAAELERAQGAVLRPEEDDALLSLGGESRESVLRSQRASLRYVEETVFWLRDRGDPFEDYENEDDDPLADTYLTLAERDFAELFDENDEAPARKVRQHVRALGWTADRTREALLAILQERARELRHRVKEQAERAKNAQRLALRACTVPADGHRTPLDRLLRYETTVERSLFRALHELHRLQAARAGRAVPPPVALDVIGAES